jgi:hypothetical protein
MITVSKLQLCSTYLGICLNLSAVPAPSSVDLMRLKHEGHLFTLADGLAGRVNAELPLEWLVVLPAISLLHRIWCGERGRGQLSGYREMFGEMGKEGRQEVKRG